MTTEVAPYIQHKLAAGRTESQSTSRGWPRPRCVIAAALSRQSQNDRSAVRPRISGRFRETRSSNRSGRDDRGGSPVEHGGSGRTSSTQSNSSQVPIAVTAARSRSILTGVWVVGLFLSDSQSRPPSPPAAARVPPRLLRPRRQPRRRSRPPQTRGWRVPDRRHESGSCRPLNSFVIIASLVQGQQLATEMAKELVNLSLPAFDTIGSSWYSRRGWSLPDRRKKRAAQRRASSSRDFPDARIQKHAVTDEPERADIHQVFSSRPGDVCPGLKCR